MTGKYGHLKKYYAMLVCVVENIMILSILL